MNKQNIKKALEILKTAIKLNDQETLKISVESVIEILQEEIS